MLNVTIKFIVYLLFFLFLGCNTGKKEPTFEEIQHVRDSVSEVRIDSAYRQIRMNCDTMMVYQVPQMVDSFLKDSSLLSQFFDTSHLFRDADTKVEKVIRQLQADCDSNLLKETYRKAQLRQKSKPKLHKKQKV